MILKDVLGPEPQTNSTWRNGIAPNAPDYLPKRYWGGSSQPTGEEWTQWANKYYRDPAQAPPPSIIWANQVHYDLPQEWISATKGVLDTEVAAWKYSNPGFAAVNATIDLVGTHWDVWNELSTHPELVRNPLWKKSADMRLMASWAMLMGTLPEGALTSSGMPEFMSGTSGLTEKALLPRELRAEGPGKGFSVRESGGPPGNPYARHQPSPGLPERATVNQLWENAWRPDMRGVTLEGEYELGDLFYLSMRNGNIEFALTEEQIEGQTVNRLYSGTPGRVNVPRDARVIAHVHGLEELPGGRLAVQPNPSLVDREQLNEYYAESLLRDPYVPRPEERIIWGPGPNDYTVFRPQTKIDILRLQQGR